MTFVPELLFATVVLAVARYRRPELLGLPTTVLFAGKSLCAPFLEVLLARREA